jgi:long-subunit fatty acid transport protein
MNFSNKLYFGASLGLQNFNYQQTSAHTETDVNNNIPNLNSFTFNEYLNASGYGGNLKVGVIFRPVDFIRLGAAFHSPTFYSITSDFHTSVDASYDIPIGVNGYYSDLSMDGFSKKNVLITPWKFVGSFALQIKQFGILSMDYERVDYSSMRLSGNENIGQNDSVKSAYKAANNFRFGAEGKIGPIALRAGLGLYGSPSKGISEIAYKTYSAGIGYRGKSFYCDLAYVILKYSNNYTLYQHTEQQGINGLPSWSNSPQVASIDNNLNRFVATIGFRF